MPPTYTRNCELKSGMVFPQGMQRLALGVEYNGAGFHGFQAQQAGVSTVQRQLEAGLSSVADEAVTVVCAGRTDAGVHATGQVVHFDTLAERPLKAWTLGVNARLPDGLAVQWAQPVVSGFHARFSALARTYRYVIYNHPIRSPVLAGRATWQKRPLDIEVMARAARCLAGEHDFTSFRAAQCQARNPTRTVEYLRLAPHRRLMVLEIKANAFLHHMVRNIVGVLIAVGAGDKPESWVEQVLAARDRRQAAVTAPADGLYFVQVDYPAQFALPAAGPGPEWLPEKLDWLW